MPFLTDETPWYNPPIGTSVGFAVAQIKYATRSKDETLLYIF